ncbi:hypothetical protein JOF56_000787 [Kibdelosporangium banguiense]|uniref:Uncharacterized protein n=1 Tax=Kibdelosporangium banguiense TaxID=1365924 RepID=A0ABS4T7L1_9PSEU|nr:hypothetical protein [Kibdelosporangium banguiense]MBP2320402.1 hypothetical protein [Kibdelosporangium banguiense]
MESTQDGQLSVAARIALAFFSVKTPLSRRERTPPLEPQLPSSTARKLTHQAGAAASVGDHQTVSVGQ